MDSFSLLAITFFLVILCTWPLLALLERRFSLDTLSKRLLLDSLVVNLSSGTACPTLRCFLWSKNMLFDKLACIASFFIWPWVLLKAVLLSYCVSI